MLMAAAHLKSLTPPPPARRSDWWCDGKEVFDSVVIANEAASRGGKTKGPRSVYRCPTCGRFHVGEDRTRKFAVTTKAAKAALIRFR